MSDDTPPRSLLTDEEFVTETRALLEKARLSILGLQDRGLIVDLELEKVLQYGLPGGRYFFKFSVSRPIKPVQSP